MASFSETRAEWSRRDGILKGGSCFKRKKLFKETSAVYWGKTFWNWKDAGATNAAKQFKKTHPHLTFGESTAWKLRDRYNDITKQKGAVDNKMTRLKRGRPLLLGAVLDEKVKHFLLQIGKLRLVVYY